MDKDANAKFECDKCGLCCKHIDRSTLLKELDLGNGVCKYLKNNMCSIYYKRPLVCNVDFMYDEYFKKYLSREEYYKMNKEICEKLKKEEL